MARGKRAARKRTRIATGVYSDRYGISIIVRGVEHRHPLGTPLEELRATRRRLKEAAGGTPSRTGTLDAAFDGYLATLQRGRPRDDQAALLQHWRDAGFGGRAPGDVTATDIQQQLAAWQGRFSDGTRKHLRRVLGTAYRWLNGRSGANPVRDVPALTIRYWDARGMPYWLVTEILEHIPDRGRPVRGKPRADVNASKIRLRVIAYTGLPPAQIMRIQPQDIDWSGQTIVARPRRKGAGTEARRLPLTPQGLDALRDFAAAGLWGPYSTRSAAKVWARARDKVRAGWEAAQQALGTALPWPVPEDAHPYDLRHSYATVVYASRGDLAAAGDALTHASLETTRRYTIAAVDARLRAAVSAASAALARALDEGDMEAEMEVPVFGPENAD